MGEYEIIAGDLHEEYFCIASSSGAKAANRWYWAQTFLSIPSLLSYSRSNRSTLRWAGVALTAFVVLLAMLVVIAVIDTVFQRLFAVNQIPNSVWACINYADVVVFGAVLARLVRSDGVRIAFFASLFLVLSFVIPALAGNPHSQAPPAAWIQLFGAVPAMCIGAGLYQAISSRIDSLN